MPAFDALLMFRTTGALTTNESTGPVILYGGNNDGLAVRVVVPGANGVNDSVNAKVYRSTDGSTYNLVSQYANAGVKTYGGAELIVPFPLYPGKQYIKLELLPTVASTTVSFGTTVAGVVENPGMDWERSVGSTTH